MLTRDEIVEKLKQQIDALNSEVEAGSTMNARTVGRAERFGKAGASPRPAWCCRGR